MGLGPDGKLTNFKLGLLPLSPNSSIIVVIHPFRDSENNESSDDMVYSIIDEDKFWSTS